LSESSAREPKRRVVDKAHAHVAEPVRVAVASGGAAPGRTPRLRALWPNVGQQDALTVAVCGHVGTKDLRVARV
jgi:hypothetical protein